ncbi:MAG: ABC transporter permease [bacterium]
MLGLYLHFWRLSLLTILQYRLNLLIWMIFGIAYHAAGVGLLWGMLLRFRSIGGWSFNELLFLYALWALGHGLYAAVFGQVGWVTRHVRDGTFDRFLTRPLNPLFQTMTVPGGITIDDLVIAIPLFVIAQHLAGVVWTPGLVLLLPGAAAGAALIEAAVLLAISTLSFWLIRIEAVRLLVETVELEFVRYPLGIFPRGAQIAFTVVLPLAFVTYLPSQVFLRRAAEGFSVAPTLGYLTPAVGLLAFGLAYMFWKYGVNQYQSTGS